MRSSIEITSQQNKTKTDVYSISHFVVEGKEFFDWRNIKY